MSNEDFDAQILSEKLSKLNNSQQSIESLSQWCVSHRKKAKQIVETWDKLFNSSPKEKCISFLYLANDILQNSRRKGSEFVSEFWKVLPAALKHVYREGEEPGKKVVTRLVDIWEERKVFGSRGHGLKDELLGKDPSPQSASNGKSSNPIKIVKRDASSKLAVGGLPEKILTAFQSVLDEDSTEEVALSKCNAAADYVGKIEEDAEKTLLQGNQQGHGLVDDLHEQENILNQCIAQMEISEATRSSLISQLKEALNDQELKLELIRTQLQIARNRIQQASNLRKRLTSPSLHGTITSGNLVAEMPRPEDQNLPLIQPTSTPLHPLALPMMSFSPLKNADEENKKAAVAAVAAKLAASTSSAQMLTSVLSSLVAEEAASMNGSSKSVGFGTGLPMFPPEKRPKLERPMLISDVGKSDIGNSTYFTPLQPQSTSSMPIAPSAGMQLPSHSSQLQTPFTSPPPPPPAPLSSVPPTSANSPANQYVQSAAMMAGVMPFGYGTNPLPPPPPLPPHMAMNLARPASQQPQQSQPEQSQQQQPSTGGYYRPPGLGFFGQNHQPATPPLPRQ